MVLQDNIWIFSRTEGKDAVQYGIALTDRRFIL